MSRNSSEIQVAVDPIESSKSVAPVTPQKVAGRHFGGDLGNLLKNSPLTQKCYAKDQHLLDTLVQPETPITDKMKALEAMLEEAGREAGNIFGENQQEYQQLKEQRQTAEKKARDLETKLAKQRLALEQAQQAQTDSAKKLKAGRRVLEKNKTLIAELLKTLDLEEKNQIPQDKQKILKKVGELRASHHKRVELLEKANARVKKAEEARKNIAKRNSAKKKKIQDLENTIATLKKQLEGLSTTKELAQSSEQEIKTLNITIESLQKELRAERQYKEESETQNNNLCQTIQKLHNEKSAAESTAMQAARNAEEAQNKVKRLSLDADEKITAIANQANTAIGEAKTTEEREIANSKRIGTILISVGSSGLGLSAIILCTIAYQVNASSFTAGLSSMMNQSPAIPLVACLLAGGLITLIIIGAIKRQTKALITTTLSSTRLIAAPLTPPATEAERQPAIQQRDTTQENTSSNNMMPC